MNCCMMKQLKKILLKIRLPLCRSICRHAKIESKDSMQTLGQIFISLLKSVYVANNVKMRLFMYCIHASFYRYNDGHEIEFPSKEFLRLEKR